MGGAPDAEVVATSGVGRASFYGGRLKHSACGLGVSILPVRFRAPPEIVIVTLRRDP